MATAQKTAAIKQAKQWCDDSVGMIFTDFRGLSVPEIQDLRGTLKDAGVEYHVVKNTLLRRALGELTDTLPAEFHKGPTATAFIMGEQPVAAKALVAFQKKHKALGIKGAFIEGGVLSEDEVIELSKLPGRTELLSILVGVVQAPIANVIGALKETIASPLRAIGAIEEKLSASGGPSESDDAQAAEASPAEQPEEPSETPAEAPAEEAAAETSEEPQPEPEESKEEEGKE